MERGAVMRSGFFCGGLRHEIRISRLAAGGSRLIVALETLRGADGGRFLHCGAAAQLAGAMSVLQLNVRQVDAMVCAAAANMGVCHRRNALQQCKNQGQRCLQKALHWNYLISYAKFVLPIVLPGWQLVQFWRN